MSPNRSRPPRTRPILRNRTPRRPQENQRRITVMKDIHVWVTRDEPPQGPLCSALTSQQLIPILEPVIARQQVSNITDQLQRLAPDDWLVLTSTFAIECIDKNLAQTPKVAVVSEKSAAKARAVGLRVELISKKNNAQSLFDELKTIAKSRRVLYPRSSEASPPTIPADCFELSSPILYETRPRNFNPSIIEEKNINVITFTSPSAARALDEKIPLNSITILIASIGPTATEAITKTGARATIQPDTPSFLALAQEIKNGTKK